MKAKILILVLALLAAPVFGQEVKHATGYKPSPFAKQLKAHSAAAHGGMLKKLVAEPLPDVYETPYQVPQQDQGNCGDCWSYAGCLSATGALMKAGVFKSDGSQILSPNSLMNCYSTGGCNGDDASTVFRVLKANGLATIADYGPYVASARGTCKKNLPLYKVDSQFNADADNDGWCTFDEICSAIYHFGPVVVTNNAGGLVDGEEVSTSFGGRTDHQVIGVGFDRTASGRGWKGKVLLKNQWGNSWGIKHVRPGQTKPEGGYTWVAARESDGHLAASCSTEVIGVIVTPVTPPTPVPPTPVPPVPPAHTVTFTIPTYTFTVPGTFYNTKVTIPAQTITAKVNESGECEDCQPKAQAVAPIVVNTPKPQSSAPRSRPRLFRRWRGFR